MRPILAATLAVAIGLLSIAARAQVSTDEAYQHLQEKQKQRDAERAKQVTISQGELDDLKTELAHLRSEIARLKQQLSQQANAAPAQPNANAPTPAPAATPKKRHTQIEIGMTRDELMAFVAGHPDSYQLEGVSVRDAGVQPNQTTITRQVITHDGSGAPQTAERKTEIIETHSAPKKHELIRVNLLQPHEVVVGRHRDALGHWTQETSVEYKKSGWIWATLENDIVTAVNVHTF